MAAEGRLREIFKFLTYHMEAEIQALFEQAEGPAEYAGPSCALSYLLGLALTTPG